MPGCGGQNRSAPEFATELRTVAAMFYDQATGRLYYTLAGQERLFYRYFTPGSQVVGALRHRAARATTEFAWERVEVGS